MMPSAATVPPLRSARTAPVRRSPAPASPPEDLLIIAAARASPGPEEAREIAALLEAGIDWPAFLEKAFRHGVAPLIYFRLSSLLPLSMPRDVLDRLRAHFDTNLRRNLFLSGELFRALSVLEARGVLAVPIRGAVLAASAYGSLALRQFTDLDLLVGKGDVLPAIEALAAIGFRPQLDLSGGALKRLLGSECELLFSARDGRVFLDLHWETAPRYFAFRQDPARLLSSLDPAPPAGCPSPSLAPEDTLLLLAAHGARHLWERLIWICDVARWIESRADLDWGRVFDDARALGGERILSVALRLASDLQGAEVPGEVSRRIEADRRTHTIAAWARERLFRRTGPPGARERVSFHLAVRERLRDRLRYFGRLSSARPPRRGRELPLLPAILRPLRFLSRAVVLAGKYLPGAWAFPRGISHERRRS